MAVRYTSFASRKIVAPFVCSLCGHACWVRFVAVGSASATTSHRIGHHGTADQALAASGVAAQSATTGDAHETFRLIACPACRRRNPAAVRAIYAASLALSGAVGLVAMGGAAFVTHSLSPVAVLVASVLAGTLTAAAAYALFLSPKDKLFRADLAKTFGPLDGPPPPLE